MLGVLQGFGIIGGVILAGYLVGRLGIVGSSGRWVWNRTVFFVALPCLLFNLLATADRSELLSPIVIIGVCAALITAAVGVTIARLVFKRSLGELVIVALGSAYVNSNNIGLPVAVYVLGSGAAVAPIILMQLVFFTPPAMILLERAALGDNVGLGRTMLAAVKNPLVVASVAGTVFSLLQVSIPTPVLAPVKLIGDAAVPLMLMSFGLSLSGVKILQRGSGRKEVAVVSLLKAVFMPAVAWILGSLVFHLDATLLHQTVVISALPAAQNVANYADRFGVAVQRARDIVLVTALLAIPVLLVVSVLS
ncbi:MAG: putative permease [Frondihabitans sp.]|nr:putative permease [Frondihabitans sp.]